MNRTPRVPRGSGVVRGHRRQRRGKGSSLSSSHSAISHSGFLTRLVTQAFGGANAKQQSNALHHLRISNFGCRARRGNRDQSPASVATASSDDTNLDVFKLEQTIDAKALPQQEIPDEVYR